MLTSTVNAQALQKASPRHQSSASPAHQNQESPE
jgi:hypothetical protein